MIRKSLKASPLILVAGMILLFGLGKPFAGPIPNANSALETYKLDPTHSYAVWQVSHFGFSDLSGKCMADGTLVLDHAHPQNSKVKVILHIADMVTGIPKLDEVLKGSNFFAADKYPLATFISNKVEPTSDTSANVTGILAIKGISKPVTLNVKLNQIGMHPYFHKKAVGFSAQTTLKRSDFGMTGYIPGVGDEVKVDIQAEAEIAPPQT